MNFCEARHFSCWNWYFYFSCQYFHFRIANEKFNIIAIYWEMWINCRLYGVFDRSGECRCPMSIQRRISSNLQKIKPKTLNKFTDNLWKLNYSPHFSLSFTGTCLKDLKITVPEAVAVGDAAILSCHYNLENVRHIWIQNAFANETAFGNIPCNFTTSKRMNILHSVE